MKRIILVILVLAVASCTSFKRCQLKFANQLTTVDSIKVPVPVSVVVPRDSVITSFVTDTTYLYKEIQQGRARVIVERTHSITTVQARCDTVTITRIIRVSVPGPRVIWGVKPWYKTAFEVSIRLLIFAIATIIFLNFRKPKSDELHSDDAELFEGPQE
jgi:hypothetical protein